MSLFVYSSSYLVTKMVNLPMSLPILGNCECILFIHSIMLHSILPVLGLDFEDVLTILTFSGQVSRQCVNISIAMDGIVEPEESFNVVLETSDPAVVLNTSTAQVLITDSDSKWSNIYTLLPHMLKTKRLWTCWSNNVFNN